MTETPLDVAHTAMQAAPNDDAARLRFFERLADAELLLLLKSEATGDQIMPDIFDADGVQVALVFDREERLAEFVGAEAPYAALSGRMLVELLVGEDVGLGVNLGVAPSSVLLPPEALAWLAQTLSAGPQQVAAKPVELAAPGTLPEALLVALDAKLPATAGLARSAYLAGATFEDGRKGHLLAFIDAAPGAENALARAASEALIFSGVEAGEMDVAFFAASDPVSARLARVALRFDLPRPEEPTAPGAPGLDPDRPPRLR